MTHSNIFVAHGVLPLPPTAPKAFGELAPSGTPNQVKPEQTCITADPNVQQLDRVATTIKNDAPISDQTRRRHHPVDSEHFGCPTRRPISDEKPLKKQRPTTAHH